MKANVQMRINTICKLLQNEVSKILLSGFISEKIFEENNILVLSVWNK